MSLDEIPEVTASHLFCRDVSFETAVADNFGRFVYLATPYSLNTVDRGGQWSFGRSKVLKSGALNWTMRLAARKVTAFSPIFVSASMVHQDMWFLEENAFGFDPLDHEFWMTWCLPALEACDAVVVPPIDGREASVGIRAEIRHAIERVKIPVYWIVEGSK